MSVDTQICIICYFIFDCNNVSFTSEVLYIFLAMAIRSIIIAAKYATFDPMKLRVIRSMIVDIKIINHDMIMASWSD